MQPFNGSGYWVPEQAEFSIRNHSSTQAVFNESFWWVGGESPANLPRNWLMDEGWGLEFEVNQYNNKDGSWVRPFCPNPGHEELFWAKNYGWTWSVLKPDYTSADLTSLGAYADYNDLSDLCDRNSITIGLRYPQNIINSGGYFGINIVVIAPKGDRLSSLFASEVVAIWDEYCNTAFGSLLAYADCMGIYPGTWTGPGNSWRMNLNITNGWFIPARCWLSFDYGDDKIEFTPCL